MRMEILHVSPDEYEDVEQRVLLLFDKNRPSVGDAEVFEYLRFNSLQPNRQYQDTRNGIEYSVYYFGHCYLEKHLPQLSALASRDQTQC